MASSSKRKRISSMESVDVTCRSSRRSTPALEPAATPHSPEEQSLPNEIVQHIWTFCDTATLQDARLGCSTWAYDMIGPALFELVTLIPHLYFLERLLFALRSRRFASKIRKMNIDLRWMDREIGSRGWTSEAPFYDPLHRAHESSLYTMDGLLNLYTCEDTDGHLRALQSASLAAVFSLAPLLETVELNLQFSPTCNSDWPGHASLSALDSCSKPPCLRAFMDSFCITEIIPSDLEYWQDSPVCWSLASALSMGAPALKKLTVNHFNPVKVLMGGAYHEDPSDWSDAGPAHPARLFGHLFGRVSHLELRLLDDHREEQWDVAEAVWRMLADAPNLETLDLQCHLDMPCQWTGFDISPHDNTKPMLARLGLVPELSKLRDLRLQDLTFSATELESFLEVKCPDLRSLKLKNCLLLGTGGDPPFLACWITTLKNLRAVLSLTTIDFGGFLTNLGRQHWHIADDAGVEHNSIKARMIAWFLNREIPKHDCPLNVFEISDEENDVSVAEDALRKSMDSSWSLTCPDSPENDPLRHWSIDSS